MHWQVSHIAFYKYLRQHLTDYPIKYFAECLTVYLYIFIDIYVFMFLFTFICIYLYIYIYFIYLCM